MSLPESSNSPLPPAFAERVETFRRGIDQYMDPFYKEARVRLEFIDPLIEALGWDIGNKLGAAEKYKEVVVEPAQAVEGHKRAPDYAVRVGGNPVFFVEAKKPAVYIRSDEHAAHQARTYAWSAQLPIVVLTNFAEIAIYNGAVRPRDKDSAGIARIFYCRINEIESKWAELLEILGKESVLRGGLDRFMAGLAKRGGSERVDQAFLRDLEATREELARHLDAKNPGLSDDEILLAVQLILDRIIFLRIAEDRRIEPYGHLQSAGQSRTPWKHLLQLFKDADARYNSGLFHFDSEPDRGAPDTLTPRLKVDASVVQKTIARFYPPSPYAFAVMPVEILGRAYESFLGKELQRDAAGLLRLELKPEVRKAGGVFYTPEWLTKYVVAQTVGPLVEGLSPEALRSPSRKGLHVVDPSCGSGSFLVAAYRYFLDWYLQHYLADPAPWSRTRPPRLEKNADGAWRLTLEERKRILVEHIFGVDIDPRAVEVAKLSLLLVVMEEGVALGRQEQLTVFKNRILPDLDKNVRCGNSLVGNDFLTDDDLLQSVEPETPIFDWNRFRPGGFEAVVGNPPWLMAGYEIPAAQLEYLKRCYSSYQGKADLYYLFIERSLEILAPAGKAGLVVPNKMQATKAASQLRSVLQEHVSKVVDFQTARIFDNATNYTQLLFFERRASDTESVEFKLATSRFEAVRTWDVPRARLQPQGWNFGRPDIEATWEAMRVCGRPLVDLLERFGNGVQTGSDKILLMSPEKAKELGIEADALRPILRGKEIRGGKVLDSAKVAVFPYVVEADRFRVMTSSELRAHPRLNAYLTSHREELRNRRWFKKSAEELSGEWWGYVYMDAASTYDGRHIVSPALSNRSNFALGDGRITPTGTAGVTVLIPKGEISDSVLLALLNSRLLSAYIIAHSTPYQGSYYKFSSPYLRDVPMVTRTPENSATLDRLGSLWMARSTADEHASEVIDYRIDGLVCQLYGFEPSVLEELEASIRPPENETGASL